MLVEPFVRDLALALEKSIDAAIHRTNPIAVSTEGQRKLRDLQVELSLDAEDPRGRLRPRAACIRPVDQENIQRVTSNVR